MVHILYGEKRMDYESLAKAILDNVGGKSNVKSVVHCATRLRFTLLDASKADTDKISKEKGREGKETNGVRSYQRF